MQRITAAWTLAVIGLIVTCSAAHAAPSASIDRAQLLARADVSAAAWSKSADTYDRAYVYPDTRPVRLDGCSSRNQAGSAGSGVPALVWTLTPISGQASPPIELRNLPGQCLMRAHLPQLGRWRIALTATDPAGQPANATKEVTFRDLVVAAIGDSFASGEGNKVKAAGDVKGWIDPQCHRSYNAWPAFVARWLENDSTAVTFLSFACSGSDIEHLTDKRYGGLKSGAKLDPQIVALGRLLGDPLRPDTRPVDVLLGATGINALDVTANLEACVEDIIHNLDILGECRKDYSGVLSALPARLDQVELTLSERLRVAQFNLIGYPSRVMTDAFDDYPKKITGLRCQVTPLCVARAALCGVFANTRVSDKQWMTKSLESVNGVLRDAADRHGWTLSPTIDRFRHHGYCAPSGITWFRSLTASLAKQGDIYGTAHPTRDGHVAAFQEVSHEVDRDTVAPAPDRFTVDIKNVRLTLPHTTDPEQQPHQIGSTRIRFRGAARVTCGPVIGLSTAARPAARSAQAGGPRFVVATGGNTVEISASAVVERFFPRVPPIPGEPGAGSSRRVTLDADRVHLRKDNWNAFVEPVLSPLPVEPPVLHAVAGSTASKFGRLELDYTITKSTTAFPQRAGQGR